MTAPGLPNSPEREAWCKEQELSVEIAVAIRDRNAAETKIASLRQQLAELLCPFKVGDAVSAAHEGGGWVGIELRVEEIRLGADGRPEILVNRAGAKTDAYHQWLHVENLRPLTPPPAWCWPP